MNNEFIGQEIEGIKAPKRSPKKQTNTPQSTQLELGYRTPANAPASIDGEREFVAVRFDTLTDGQVFSREIKPNTYIMHTKDKSLETIFPPDFIVWIFRKRVEEVVHA